MVTRAMHTVVLSAVVFLLLPSFAAASTFEGRIDAEAGSPAIVVSTPIAAPPAGAYTYTVNISDATTSADASTTDPSAIPGPAASGGGNGPIVGSLAMSVTDGANVPPAGNTAPLPVGAIERTNVVGAQDSASETTSAPETSREIPQTRTNGSSGSTNIASGKNVPDSAHVTDTVVAHRKTPHPQIEAQAAAAASPRNDWHWLIVLLLLFLLGYWAWRISKRNTKSEVRPPCEGRTSDYFR